MAREQPTYPVYTIGHSTRSIDEFLALIEAAHIERVIDVRAFPGSRAQPQFNGDVLEKVLADKGLGYRHLRELGGRRRRSPETPAALNAMWRNRSFHNYADYALTDDFQAALMTLSTWGRCAICAIMCAEAVWWRCHRRIIADYLIAAGHDVFHILGANQIERARLTSGAQVKDARVTYPLREATTLAGDGHSHVRSPS
jgi:uncharacterized protein (DUF488 family)